MNGIDKYRIEEFTFLEYLCYDSVTDMAGCLSVITLLEQTPVTRKILEVQIFKQYKLFLNDYLTISLSNIVNELKCRIQVYNQSNLYSSDY
ncbi:hypothetical protein Anas_08647 [Armadillidium nasatum]|uniref:Uncharacterized protein n=1 Tax=Armadillidium nasatum TaxID=96803 RepID=A0A5N5TE35_9CRUS|nr:hypothetical protein Anas_08647 [Armadillidium nasatum]